MNYVTASQNWKTYNTSNLAYNILKEEDRNITNLSNKAQNRIDNAKDLNTDITNISDSNLLYHLVSRSFYSTTLIKMQISIIDSNKNYLTLSNTDIDKYGFIYFMEDSVNSIKDDYSKLNIDTYNSVVNFKLDNVAARAVQIINISNQDFDKYIYFKIIKKDSDNKLLYSKLYKFNMNIYLSLMTNAYKSGTIIGNQMITLANYYSETLD